MGRCRLLIGPGVLDSNITPNEPKNIGELETIPLHRIIVGTGHRKHSSRCTTWLWSVQGCYREIIGGALCEKNCTILEIVVVVVVCLLPSNLC